MKVFLSWSGDESRAAAVILKEWLPCVVQALDPWMSDEDIQKGAVWTRALTDQLAACKVGIVCVTATNQGSPWLNFEAGALANAVGDSCCIPYLLRLDKAELKKPLALFQATAAEKADTRRMISTLNAQLADGRLKDPQLDAVFEKWWPDLDSKLAAIPTSGGPSPAPRSDRDILEEILGHVRESERRDLRAPVWTDLLNHRPSLQVAYPSVPDKIMDALRAKMGPQPDSSEKSPGLGGADDPA